MADMQPGVEDTHDVAVAQRIPRVLNRVLSEADVDPGAVQLRHPRHAAAFRPAVEAPLQMNAFGRAGDKVNARGFEQAEQLRAVGIVVGAHGAGMAGGDLRAHAAHPGLFRQHLQKARLRVVGFIAVHVHQAAVALGQVHQKNQRADALIAGVFVVRNAAHHVGAHFDGAGHQFASAGEGLNALLREGDNLQIDKMGRLFFHSQHRLKRRQGRVGDINVGAHVLHAVVAQHADGFQRPLACIFDGDARFALAPAGDALKQGTAHIPLRLARRQGGVKMDMRLDEWRDNQLLLGIDIAGVSRLRRGLRADAFNHAVL